MNAKPATTLVVVLALVLSCAGALLSAEPASAAPPDSNNPGTRWPINGYPPDPAKDNAILLWNEELLQAIRLHPGQTGPTITSRAIGVLHTATYDAWAAYDATAVPTLVNGNERRPEAERNEANKKEAISYAAYRVLQNLFPAGRYPRIGEVNFAGQMEALGYRSDGTTPTAAAQVGARAADAVIASRANDGANQSGNYADTTGYTPERAWNEPPLPRSWHPLCVLTPTGRDAGKPIIPPAGTCPAPDYAVQNPLTPHWRNVRSFALDAPNQFMPPRPPADDTEDIELALADTSNLTDAEKAAAEYWADGPGTEFPPGHWAVIAQALSRRNRHTLDTDAKMFFVLGNALLDAGISSWSAKYEHDYWRPITAIRHHYRGQRINSWLGPYRGYGMVPAEQWLPYQAPHVVTPPFPEYTSGHSTFSAAGRIAIIAFTGTDNFRAQVTIPAGSSLFEPRTATHAGTPARDVTLTWKNLLDASNQSGMSRRWGGIHFESGDMHGRANGASVGYWAYDEARKYFTGTATPAAVPAP